MTRARAGRYASLVPFFRAWSTHGTTAVARVVGSILLCLLATVAAARADVSTFDAADMPIVRVNVQQGNVTIRTWDRPAVQIDADPSLQIVQRSTEQSGAPYAVPIPYIAQDDAELPAENFVATIPAGSHEAIIVRDVPGSHTVGDTPVTVTIPNNSAFVFARTGNGTLDVQGYRGGTFVGFVGRGRMELGGMGGTVFAQTARGPLTVTDSSFDRFRGRSLFGNVTFERCDVRQIETTTVYGSIVYDRGTFAPGLARFESQRGDVAVGSDGPAQLGGHAAGEGRVYTSFQHNARIDGRDGDASAIVDGGGPVVTAMTQSGNVFFYDGSLRSRQQQLAPQWQAPIGALQRPEMAVRREAPLPGAPAFVHQNFPGYRQLPSQPPRRFTPPVRPRVEGRRAQRLRNYR
jgi:hypothetical protein